MSDSAIRTIWKTPIAERTTPLLSLAIVDEAGDAIPTLSALTLTLHCSGQVINGRERTNVLGSFAAGTLSFRFTADDTPILSDGLQHETHTALLEWTWDGGTRHGKHEVIHVVRNLALVPA